MQNPREPFSRSQHWLAGSILFFSTIALFWNFLSPSGHVVLSKMGEDLSGQFVWWRQFGFDELRKGHLALWAPQIFSGEPYFGGFQSALLYPPNWLFMVLPQAFAINSSIALHIFLAGLFTYAWLSFRGSSWIASLMAAFMFMFGASMVLHIVPGHLPNLCTMAWIPLVFLSVDVCLQKKDWHWVLLGMFALAMQIFSGHIQYVYYTVVMLGFYVLFLLFQTQEGRGSFLTKFILMGCGAGLLTAIQLLAGWDTANESARAKVLDIDFIDIADISPERLWCLFMPDFFNGWKNYWGGGIYWEGAVFVSVTAFVFAVWALVFSKNPHKKFFGITALVLVLIGVGKRTPLFALFCKYFPLFSRFRGVGKLNIFISLCLVVLAAIGLDEVLQNSESLRRFRTYVLRASELFLLIAVIFGVTPRLGGGKLFKNYLIHSVSMTQSLALCAVTLALVALVAALTLKQNRWRYGFLVLCFMELFFFAWSNEPSFDLDQLKTQVSQIQKTYEQDAGDYRVFTGVNNYPLGTSGFSAWGDDPAVPLRYDEFTTLTHSLRTYYHDFNEPLHDYPQALSLARLKYAFYEKDGSLVAQKLDLRPVPRVFLVSNWKKAPLDSIWPEILSPKFDVHKTVWLEQDPGFVPHTSQKQAAVTVNDLSTDSIEISTQTTQPSVLVMSDNYSHGWKATAYADSSQKLYQVMPANGFQRAVVLEAGQHHFLLEYKPAVFVIGCWISWVSWLLFIGCLFLTVRFSRRY